MDLGSYFRIAVYFCLVMIIFTFAVNFVSALSIFPSASSAETSAIQGDVLTQVSGFAGGWQYLWLLILTGAGLGTLVIAKLVGSTNIIGVFLFSSIFWTSYNRCLTVVHINNFVPLDFLAIFTIGLAFIWVAAIISMFTSIS